MSTIAVQAKDLLLEKTPEIDYFLAANLEGEHVQNFDMTPAEFDALKARLAELRGVTLPATGGATKPMSEIKGLHRETLIKSLKWEVNEFCDPYAATLHELQLLGQILGYHRNECKGTDESILLESFERQLARDPQYIRVPDVHLAAVKKYIEKLQSAEAVAEATA